MSYRGCTSDTLHNRPTIGTQAAHHTRKWNASRSAAACSAARLRVSVALKSSVWRRAGSACPIARSSPSKLASWARRALSAAGMPDGRYKLAGYRNASPRVTDEAQSNKTLFCRVYACAR